MGCESHYDGVVASSDGFTPDLTKCRYRRCHAWDDDQIVPYADWSVERTAAEERHLEDLQGFPHGMLTTQADMINADILAFIRS